ncbi:hypothetical protein A3K74_00230 [Candidatus Pacearchaeota archaeon RBG_13_33_26]|nr:MAG: hypothetical protein A3K74_00230 [Candidatus Pacearchaeota archaeon RBG_13_33_26]
MRILYGVCGDGFGHSSRAMEIISHLQKKGHKVLVFTFGQATSVLKNAGFRVVEVEGLELIFKNNKPSLKETIINNSGRICRNLIDFYRIKKIVDNFSPDICISDMETVVPVVSFFYSLPLVSIDNQHIIAHLKMKVPKGYKKDFYLTKIGISGLLKADAFVILSFLKKRTRKENVYIVNPILRKEILLLKPKIKDKVLVYQTKPDKRLIKILRKIPEQFVIYGYNMQKKEGNLEFRKVQDKFFENLSDCKAIIATSGFSLISEALYLGKPYFAIPLKQFEQELNALFVMQSGYGEYSEKPSKKKIEHFLANLDFYRKKIKRHKINPKEAFAVIDRVLKKVKKEYYI